MTMLFRDTLVGGSCLPTFQDQIRSFAIVSTAIRVISRTTSTLALAKARTMTPLSDCMVTKLVNIITTYASVDCPWVLMKMF